jgi:hypothetical protein
MPVTGERHLRLVLNEYTDHHNSHRPHRSLHQSPPAGRPHPPILAANVRVLRRDRLGGLIHDPPRPGTPPPDSDSRPADALVTGLFDRMPGAAPKRRAAVGRGQGPGRVHHSPAQTMTGGFRGAVRDHPARYASGPMRCTAAVRASRRGLLTPGSDNARAPVKPVQLQAQELVGRLLPTPGWRWGSVWLAPEPVHDSLWPIACQCVCPLIPGCAG